MPPSITKSPHQSALSLLKHPTRVWGIRKTRFLYLPAERKHPHACGENCLASLRWSQILETPPRIWGKPLPHKSDTSNYRNTPTCVGKTSWENICNNIAKKHPHACEEDLTVLSVEACPKETPPHRWGRHMTLIVIGGFMPSKHPQLVGKTEFIFVSFCCLKKHPHVFGEDKKAATVRPC